LSHDEQILHDSLIEAIQDGRVAIIGPIRQEVLSGIKDHTQFEKLRASLEAFPDEPLTTQHYEEAARLFNLCRSRGVECGSTDILICAVAIHMQWIVLTYDQGLKRCLGLLRNEGLMP
jgi:predicted nucleic acid-binding protein